MIKKFLFFGEKSTKIKKTFRLPLIAFSALIILIIIQLTITVKIYFVYKDMRSEFISYEESSSKTMNRIYSQVWLLNSRINKIWGQGDNNAFD